VILLDTSGLLAAFYPDQRQHDECARAIAHSASPRILSPFVLAELDYFISKYGGVNSELRFLGEVRKEVYEIAPFDREDIAEAMAVIELYSDLSIGLADASIVVLAERYGTRDVLTLDERHFRALRPPGRRSFRILPADA
jgi:predicted nucleic acid-binding protein